MQLELAAAGGRAPLPLPSGPRLVALFLPDLPLQRVLRGREAAGAARDRARSPLAIEREGRIIACDAEARARGVRPGEALAQGHAACADLEVVAVDEAEDRAALEGLAEALLALAPAVEVASPDALLLDASAAHLLGPRGEGEAALADAAVALAAGLGLRARAAVANGRAPARALARHGRGPGAGEGTLALGVLPLGALELPAPLEARLLALGLSRVGELARFPPETLAHRLGAPGLAAWRLSHGDDPSPLVPYTPERLPEERLELEAPLESSEPLLFGLKRLSDRLAARLAGRGLGATRLALTLRLDPHGVERVAIALALPTAAASRWLLVLRERLGSLRLPGAVVGATLAVAEAATAPVEQLALDERPQQLAALETVLTRLAARLGEEALFAAEPVDRHRPEGAYRTAAFGRKKEGAVKGRRRTPTSTSEPSALSVAAPEATRSRRAATSTSTATPTAAARPTRLLAHPEPLLALGEGGRLTAVRAMGRTLRVLELSPAERLAGEWWAEPFDRDYHRARVEGLGDCWIFRDAADGRLWLHGFFD